MAEICPKCGAERRTGTDTSTNYECGSFQSADRSRIGDGEGLWIDGKLCTVRRQLAQRDKQIVKLKADHEEVIGKMIDAMCEGYDKAATLDSRVQRILAVAKELKADNEKMHEQDKAITVCKCKTCDERVPYRHLRDGLCPSCLKAENKRLTVMVELAIAMLEDGRPTPGFMEWRNRLDKATTNRMNATETRK